MSLQFPPSPSDGDSYAGYTYNAAKNVWQWDVLSPSVESLSDTNIVAPTDGEILKYAGGEWVNSVGGGLVAVKEAFTTSEFVQSSVGVAASVVVPGLSITHQVSKPGNKVILIVNLGTVGTTNGFGNVGVALSSGSTFLRRGDAVSGQSQTGASNATSHTGAIFVGAHLDHQLVYTPGSGSETYNVNLVNTSSSTQTLYLNRLEGAVPGVSQFYSRSTSSLMLLEVAV